MEHREMRRQDRLVTDPAHIREFIQSADCIHIGFCDEGEVYIVPLNYGFEEKDGQYIFYMHGAKEGRKIDLARKAPSVGFELDTKHVPVTAEIACGHSMAYQSVIGNGNICIVEDADEKIHGLQLLMEHQTGRANWEFPAERVGAIEVLKLTTTYYTAKEKPAPQ